VNVSPYIKSLSMMTCVKLVKLFEALSKPSFLFATERNHRYLTFLLEAFNNIIQVQHGCPWSPPPLTLRSTSTRATTGSCTVWCKTASASRISSTCKYQSLTRARFPRRRCLFSPPLPLLSLPSGRGSNHERLVRVL
jgi:hypothetical protein